MSVQTAGRLRTTLIRGGDVLVQGPGTTSTTQRLDVLVRGQNIAAIGQFPEAAKAQGLGHLGVGGVGEIDEIVDATGHLVMPGLVNGHLHSWEALFRGRYPCLPLEVWGLYAYPLFAAYAMPPRLAYLRTAAIAMESLLNGVTTVLDDVYETPTDGYDHLAEVFAAYRDVGVRANCSSRLFDRRFADAIPFLDEFLGERERADLTGLGSRGSGYYVDLSERALAEFHGQAGGRLRYVLAPSGPQRCSPELIRACVDLAEQHDSVVHIHVLETKIQALSGPELFQQPLLQYLDTLGALTPRTTMAHGVWLSESDIALAAERDVCVVHNPVSNLKLGSGVAPLAQYLRAGVRIALGSDGISSNDSARLFEVMKLAALLPTMTDDDYHAWPTAADVFHAATVGGAGSVGLADQIGALTEGRRADIVLVDLRTTAFTPLNDVLRQLVFAESGSSVRHVMVDGEFVVRDGAITHLDQMAVLDELRGLSVEFLEQHAGVESAMERFEPAIEGVYRRVMGADWPLSRRFAASAEGR